MSKLMTAAAVVFAAYPDADAVYVCSDGAVFLEERLNLAENHCRNERMAPPTLVRRSEVGGTAGVADAEAEAKGKAEADQAAAEAEAKAKAEADQAAAEAEAKAKAEADQAAAEAEAKAKAEADQAAAEAEAKAKKKSK